MYNYDIWIKYICFTTLYTSVIFLKNTRKDKKGRNKVVIYIYISQSCETFFITIIMLFLLSESVSELRNLPSLM